MTIRAGWALFAACKGILSGVAQSEVRLECITGLQVLTAAMVHTGNFGRLIAQLASLQLAPVIKHQDP